MLIERYIVIAQQGNFINMTTILSIICDEIISMIETPANNSRFQEPLRRWFVITNEQCVRAHVKIKLKFNYIVVWN